MSKTSHRNRENAGISPNGLNNASTPTSARGALQLEQSQLRNNNSGILGRLASVTEQTLVAKERFLASLYTQRNIAIEKNQLQEVGALQKVINAHKRSWEKMWVAPYSPSKIKSMTASQALSIQVDKLQAVVSRRIGKYISKLDKEQIDPLNKKINIYEKLLLDLENEKAKNKGLHAFFLGDKLDKDIEHTKKLMEPYLKKRSQLLEKREKLIGEYMEFVAYLESGRATIKELRKTTPHINQIKLSPIPVTNVSSGFKAVNGLLDSVRTQVLQNHKDDIVNPAQRNSKLRKQTVEEIDKEFNKLNGLSKFFAGDIGAHSREMSKEASVHYAQVLGRHKIIMTKFNDFAETIKIASSSFEKGQPIAFTTSFQITSGTRQVNRSVQRSYDFSDKGIITALGLNPELLKKATFTRNNEGTPVSERKIHWPGYNSGVTLSGGYDLGHKSKAQVRKHLELVNKGLHLVGEEEIHPKICKLLLGAVGLRGTKARDYLRRNPSLRKYQLPAEATDVFIYQYYRNESATTERVVNKNLSKYDKKNNYSFDDIPEDIQILIVDTVTRGDFKSLYNPTKREKYYSALIKGLETNHWEGFLNLYKEGVIFTLNPNINRHGIREEKAEEIKENLALGRQKNRSSSS
jgi:hypothetical protein